MSFVLSGCANTYGEVAPVEQNRPPKVREEKSEDRQGNYSIEQAMSDRAQLSTIAYSGLAFITGSEGADTFMPPGKVADFFGFQYMRDVDEAGYGHNTQFLTRVANNMLYILDDNQKAQLVELAVEQAPLYRQFAYNRLPLMEAFRDNLEGNIPEGSSGLSIENAGLYTASLYEIDAELSYNRAIVLGKIINSFTETQLAYLENMSFNNFNTWPDVEEDEELKRSMGHTEFVAVMTYASEMFSWFKGSVEADVYYCPERHGTYFGGFFLKDYPAMNNPDYFISTSVTGDKGQLFLEVLNDDQRLLIEGIIDEQRDGLNEITELRTLVSKELRKSQVGETVDEKQVVEWIKRYGQLDGELSALYAQRFAVVNKTLSDEQREALIALRDLDVVPEGVYMFSAPTATPTLPDVAYLFGISDVPENIAAYDVPDGFDSGSDTKDNKRPKSNENRPKPKEDRPTPKEDKQTLIQ